MQNCPRPFCGGQVEYTREYGRISASCLLCGRSPLPVRVDRTPPDRAEHVEASLVREGRPRRGLA